MILPAAFTERPIAHRGLHSMREKRPENSLSAIGAAVAGGFGIEIDVQPSSDGAAMVFHDERLKRLTGEDGLISDRPAAALSHTPLLYGAGEGVPSLPDVLALVAGRAPLLVEIKDQDGALGPNVGPLEAAVARALERYTGPVAVMSFNPHSIAAFARFAPKIPRGLVTDPFSATDWHHVPAERRATLRAIPDLDRVGGSFISHNAKDLAAPRVAELKAAGYAILCWTIRSAEEEEAARQIADTVTFENYLPNRPDL